MFEIYSIYLIISCHGNSIILIIIGMATDGVCFIILILNKIKFLGAFYFNFKTGKFYKTSCHWILIGNFFINFFKSP